MSYVMTDYDAHVRLLCQQAGKGITVVLAKQRMQSGWSIAKATGTPKHSRGKCKKPTVKFLAAPKLI